MLINLLVWIIVGGIAGWLASAVVQGGGMGIVADVIVGIVGALIGGFLLSLLLPGTFGISGFNLGSLIVAFIGAVILLAVVRLFTGRRAVSASASWHKESRQQRPVALNGTSGEGVTRMSQPLRSHLMMPWPAP